MRLPDEPQFKELRKHFEALEELSKEAASTFRSIRDQTEENEGILQEIEERTCELRSIENANEREGIRLDNLKFDLQVQQIRYDGLMKRAEERLELLERKPVEWMEEVIMALECDEHPDEILRRFRQTLEIITGSWA